MQTINDIEIARRRSGRSKLEICRAAGVAYSTYWFNLTGKTRMRELTRIKLARALSNRPAPKRVAAATPELIRATYRGYMLAFARHFFPGLPPDGAAIEALAQEPGRSAVSDLRWANAAKARALAVYGVVIDLGLPGKRVAEAIGVTRAAVSQILRRVEDWRDEDPKIDAMIETATRVIAGPEGGIFYGKQEQGR